MRLTRAALRAEAPLESETLDASNTHSDLKRVPLGEVTANAAFEATEPEPKAMPAKKSKAKGATKKSAQGKKGKAAQEEQDNAAAEVLEDARQAAGSPASDAAADELATPPTDDIVQVPMSDQRPASPPSRAVRMTRRQLAKQEEEKSQPQQHQAGPLPPPEPVTEIVEEVTPGPEHEVEERVLETNEGDAVEDQGPDVIAPQAQEVPPAPQEIQVEINETVEPNAPVVAAPEVEITSEPEPKTLASEKPYESGQATPAASRPPSRSPSKSPARSPMRLEESIEAIDALEEALENVIPNFNPAADDQSPRKAKFGDVTRSGPSNAVNRPSMATARVSKNPTAPRSLKPAAAPRPSVTRSSSVRAAPPKEPRKGSGEVVDYLASKRRPISMNFPTPPPPPRNTRPPTKSTFQLPGEAIAAKLKAQKEERLKREQEGGKRPVSGSFTGPVIKSSKPPTKSNFQLPGEAVAAKLKAQKEERLKREAEGATERPGSVTTFRPPPPPKSSKPPTMPTFQLPGEAVAARLKAQKEERLKREEEEAAKKAAFKARPAPAPRKPIAPVRQTSASKAREALMTTEKKENSNNSGGVTIPARPTSSVNNNAAKRTNIMVSRPPLPSSSSSTTSTNSKRTSIITPIDAAAQRLKGREIFNRDRMEKEQRENERREKEEAARKARAEAAERGRIASREWAEKQRRKMMGGGAATKPENT